MGGGGGGGGGSLVAYRGEVGLVWLMHEVGRMRRLIDLNRGGARGNNSFDPPPPPNIFLSGAGGRGGRSFSSVSNTIAKGGKGTRFSPSPPPDSLTRVVVPPAPSSSSRPLLSCVMIASFSSVAGSTVMVASSLPPMIPVGVMVSSFSSVAGSTVMVASSPPPTIPVGEREEGGEEGSIFSV